MIFIEKKARLRPISVITSLEGSITVQFFLSIP